jgi:hypothetical protein
MIQGETSASAKRPSLLDLAPSTPTHSEESISATPSDEEFELITSKSKNVKAKKKGRDEERTKPKQRKNISVKSETTDKDEIKMSGDNDVPLSLMPGGGVAAVQATHTSPAQGNGGPSTTLDPLPAPPPADIAPELPAIDPTISNSVQTPPATYPPSSAQAPMPMQQSAMLNVQQTPTPPTLDVSLAQLLPPLDSPTVFTFRQSTVSQAPQQSATPSLQTFSATQASSVIPEQQNFDTPRQTADLTTPFPERCLYFSSPTAASGTTSPVPPFLVSGLQRMRGVAPGVPGVTWTADGGSTLTSNAPATRLQIFGPECTRGLLDPPLVAAVQELRGSIEAFMTVPSAQTLGALAKHSETLTTPGVSGCSPLMARSCGETFELLRLYDQRRRELAVRRATLLKREQDLRALKQDLETLRRALHADREALEMSRRECQSVSKTCRENLGRNLQTLWHVTEEWLRASDGLRAASRV